MAQSKSNGLSGTAPRRRGRGRPVTEDAAAGPASASADGVARIDALALALAEVPERSAIIERSVREVMALVPAESVVVLSNSDHTPFEEGDTDPARATIPLEVGGRHYGAFELRLKPERVPDAAERTYLLAIARQCALALSRLPAVDASAGPGQPIDPEAVTAALDRVTAGVRALVSVARSAALPSPRRIAEAEHIAISNLDDLRRRVGV